MKKTSKPGCDQINLTDYIKVYKPKITNLLNKIFEKKYLNKLDL